MKPLNYSEYINDRAIIEALRIPRIPPEGQSVATWPLWHDPNDPESKPLAQSSKPWSPGDPWPIGDRWSHDEVLFIRSHQAFEVWFSVVLHEIDGVLQKARNMSSLSSTVPFSQIDLAHRQRETREFSPTRFPALNRVAQEFSPGLRNLIFDTLPTPGYHPETASSLKFDGDVLDSWAGSLQRAAKGIEVTIPFFDVLGTMTAHQFLRFRDRLSPASGFGSAQFRELEMVLGLREINQRRIQPREGSEEDVTGSHLPYPMKRPTAQTPTEDAITSFYRQHSPKDWGRLARRYRETSLRDLAYSLLSANVFGWADKEAQDREFDAFAARNLDVALKPIASFDHNLESASALNILDGLREVISHQETIVAAMLATKGSLKSEQIALRDFLDSCMALDRALLRWRDHHIRFVEGMIGRRPGTGGAGVNYLRETVDAGRESYFTHAVPCLWHARTLVQRE